MHTWPKRALADVPGLKALLIQRFELEYEDWDWQDSSNPRTEGLTMEEILAEMPGVQFIPAVLAIHWPGDDDVERFLLDNLLPNDRKLRLLNAGRFTSAEANAVRMEAVTDDRFGRNVRIILPDDSVAEKQELPESATLQIHRESRLHALQGLALSRSQEAIPHLITLGIEWPLPAILESLDRYDDAELMPYRQDLIRMLSGMRIRLFSRDDFHDFSSRYDDAPSGAPR